MQKDPRKILDTSPMSRAQVVAIAVTTALSALDGFDVLSVTFAAPGIIADWGVAKSEIGLIFASGLIGMALGSLFLAPLADAIGRRRMVIINLLIMTMGMSFCALSETVHELSFWRVITGVGIMTVGYPIGGVVGGFVSAELLQHYNWQSVFWLGASMSVMLLSVVLLWLSESLAYLMERQNTNTRERVSELLERFGHKGLDVLLAARKKRPAMAYGAIFAKGQVAATLQITAVNFLFVITVYYFFSWLPQMVVDAGYSASTATSVSALANLAGVIGAVILGLLSHVYGLRPVMIISMLGLGIATTLFGFVRPELLMLQVMAAIAGACLFGGIAGIFTTIGNTFAPHMRATGTGFVIGVGRGGSALAPAIAGALFSIGASRFEVSLALGSCAFIAGLVLLLPINKPPAENN